MFVIERMASYIESNSLLERVTRTPKHIAYGRAAVFAAGSYTTIEAIMNPSALNIVAAVVLDSASAVSIGGAAIRHKAGQST